MRIRVGLFLLVFIVSFANQGKRLEASRLCAKALKAASISRGAEIKFTEFENEFAASDYVASKTKNEGAIGLGFNFAGSAYALSGQYFRNGKLFFHLLSKRKVGVTEGLVLLVYPPEGEGHPKMGVENLSLGGLTCAGVACAVAHQAGYRLGGKWNTSFHMRRIATIFPSSVLMSSMKRGVYKDGKPLRMELVSVGGPPETMWARASIAENIQFAVLAPIWGYIFYRLAFAFF